MKFQTYGPFKISMDVDAKSDHLAKQFNDRNPKLNEASGVYIFTDGSLPLYVGEAYKNSFGTRIAAHFNRPHNSGLREWLDTSKAQPNLILIALSKENGELAKAERNTGTQHYAIHRLEESMIGACLAVNENLFNIRSVGYYKDTHVPGYLNTSATDRKTYPAAEVLEQLLGKKK